MLIIACSIMVLLTGFYTLLPLFGDSGENLGVKFLTETEEERLLYRKAVVSSTLEDLEFDYKMGKLVYEDFHRLESGYKAEAAMILQKLDRLGAGAELDESIEGKIAARKSDPFLPGEPCKDATSRCRSCGAELMPGKKFCPDCGNPINDTISQ
jgi:hypothetical protein